VNSDAIRESSSNSEVTTYNELDAISCLVIAPMFSKMIFFGRKTSHIGFQKEGTHAATVYLELYKSDRIVSFLQS